MTQECVDLGSWTGLLRDLDCIFQTFTERGLVGNMRQSGRVMDRKNDAVKGGLWWTTSACLCDVCVCVMCVCIKLCGGWLWSLRKGCWLGPMQTSLLGRGVDSISERQHCPSVGPLFNLLPSKHWLQRPNGWEGVLQGPQRGYMRGKRKLRRKIPQRDACLTYLANFITYPPALIFPTWALSCQPEVLWWGLCEFGLKSGRVGRLQNEAVQMVIRSKGGLHVSTPMDQCLTRFCLIWSEEICMQRIAFLLSLLKSDPINGIKNLTVTHKMVIFQGIKSHCVIFCFLWALQGEIMCMCTHSVQPPLRLAVT